MAEHEHDEPDDENEVEGIEDAIESAMELDTQSQIFLEMRGQNLELLKIAVEMAGFSGPHSQIKHGDLKGAMRTIWEVYSEFYAWVDPEESEDDEDEDDQ